MGKIGAGELVAHALNGALHTGGISDTQHGARTVASPHTHAKLATVTANQHHNQLHLASHYPLTGGDPLTVTRSATVYVAASDASALSKIWADYVCTGTNDEVTILAAIAALPASGGTVQLSEGTFSCDAGAGNTIDISASDVTLAGMGMSATTIDFADKTSWSADLYLSGARCVVRDLTASGSGSGVSVVESVVVLGGADCRAIRVRGTDCSTGADANGDSANIQTLSTAARAQIIDCESDNGNTAGDNRGGVKIDNPDDVLIHGLYSHDNAKNGILLYTDVNDSVTIIDYHSDSDGASGLKFLPTSNRQRLARLIEIVNPHIDRAGAMGIDGSAIGTEMDLSCLTVRGGVVERSNSNGIDLGAFTGGATFIGVTSRLNNYLDLDISDEGFGFGGVLHRTHLIGCKIYSNGSAGIGIWDCNDALVESCQIYNNGLWRQGRGVMVFDSGVPSTYNRVKDCLFDDWQETAAKTLTATAAAAQKVIKVVAADGAVFFPGQKVSIDDTGDGAELNVIESIATVSTNAELTMINDLAREYTTGNSATVTGVATQLAGIEEYDDSDYNIYEGNNLRSAAITTKITILGANSIARNNIGVTPVAVTGARDLPEGALKDILAKVAGVGLITDSTSES